MSVHADKPAETKTRSAAFAPNEGEFHITDNRPETVRQKRRLEMTGSSEQVSRLSTLGEIANGRPGTVGQKKAAPEGSAPSALVSPLRKENNTGLPDRLKTGIERLSGFSMNDVKVHYGSGKPAQLQAHAYAQGTDIHLAPGQERHLPHEAWHVVQQKQGRVKPTVQLKSVNINDDAGLEKEADTMGAKAAADAGGQSAPAVLPTAHTGSGTAPVQRMLVEDIPVDKQGNALTPGQVFLITTGDQVQGLKSVRARFIGSTGTGLYIFRTVATGVTRLVVRGSNVEPAARRVMAAAAAADPTAYDMDAPMTPSTGTGAALAPPKEPVGFPGMAGGAALQSPALHLPGSGAAFSPVGPGGGSEAYPRPAAPMSPAGTGSAVGYPSVGGPLSLPSPAGLPGMAGGAAIQSPALHLPGSGAPLSPALPLTGSGSGAHSRPAGPMPDTAAGNAAGMTAASYLSGSPGLLSSAYMGDLPPLPALMPLPGMAGGAALQSLTPHLPGLSPAGLTGGGSGARPPAALPMLSPATGSGSGILALPLPVTISPAAAGSGTGSALLSALSLPPLPSLSANGAGLAPVPYVGAGMPPAAAPGAVADAVADSAASGSSMGAAASVHAPAKQAADSFTGAAGIRAGQVYAIIRAAYGAVPSVPKATLWAHVKGACPLSDENVKAAILFLRKKELLFPAFPGPNFVGVKNFSLDRNFTDGDAKGKKPADKSLTDYIQTITTRENIAGDDKHDKVRNTLIAVIQSDPDDATWKVYRQRLIVLFNIKTAAKYYTDTYVRAGDEHEQLITSETADQVLYDLQNPTTLPVTVSGAKLTALDYQRLTNVATQYIVLKSLTRHDGDGGKYSQNHHPTSKKLISFVDFIDPEKLHGSPGSGPGGSPAYHEELAGKIAGRAELEQLNKELMEINIRHLAGRFDILRIPASQRVNQLYVQTDGTELHFNNEPQLHLIARNVEVRRRKVLGLFRVVHELLSTAAFRADVDTLPMGARSPHEMDNLPATPERYDRGDDKDDNDDD